MTVEMSHEQEGKVMIVKLTGKLTRRDYDLFVPAVERQIGKYGKVNMLVEMQDFHGWDAGALWEDIKFDFKHFSDIEKLAFIGDKKWEKGMAQFCRPFTTAKIKFFEPPQLQEAREWLTIEPREHV